MEPYDLEAVYDAQIAPLMKRIIAICQEHHLSMIASFAYRHDGRGDFDLCSTLLPFEGRTPEEFANAMGLIYRKGSEL